VLDSQDQQALLDLKEFKEYLDLQGRFRHHDGGLGGMEEADDVLG
jgi:hypothetical protein